MSAPTTFILSEGPGLAPLTLCGPPAPPPLVDLVWELPGDAPDWLPDRVADAVADWMEEHGLDVEDVALGHPITVTNGLIAWTTTSGRTGSCLLLTPPPPLPPRGRAC